MAAWFQKAPLPEKDSESFSLRIESHPDTHLLQTLQLSESDSIQILQLGKHYYALKKTKYQRSPALLIQDPEICEHIRKQELQPGHLEHLFPTRRLDILIDDQSPLPQETKETKEAAGPSQSSKNLTAKLKEAMAEFIENNPDTAQALNLKRRPETATPQSESKPAALAAYSQHGSLAGATAEKPQPPLNQLTQAAVFTALQQASENQQAHLEKAQKLKQNLEKNDQRLHTLLEQLPTLEARFENLSMQLETLYLNWSPKDSLKPEELLKKTGRELAELQSGLETALTEALSLHNLIEIYTPTSSQRFKEPLKDLKYLIEAIVAQRHQVNYFLQQQAFKELEELRLSHLRQRKDELLTAISELQTSIEQIDTINQEILNHDPLAVPEPIPALALHELSRLEQELQYVLADPALRLNTSRENTYP